MNQYKVFYGEYTLKHWIDLILKKDIILPPYQRSFVWSKERTSGLIKSLEEGFFVPPVIIASLSMNNKWENYILDGQQRLTSVLLRYLNIFPDEDKFKDTGNDALANDNDDEEEEDSDNINILNWTLRDIQDAIQNREKENILKNLMKSGKYKEFDINTLNSEFFEKTCLPFAYIKPTQDSENDQVRYYSSVFRRINTGAQSLLPLEARASMYWLNKDFKDFFQPVLFKQIKTNTKVTDFARYMSILAEYDHLKRGNKNISLLARGFRYKMETYIENFIYHTIGDKPSTTFTEFKSIFPSNQYQDKINYLKEDIKYAGVPEKLQSIVDADYYLFGLIYFVLFENKRIDTNKVNNLDKDIKQAISDAKEKEKRQPAALKYLTSRVKKSIEIYGRYIKDEHK
ncbi:MAG: DUF262 domain-containing protein [Elusimicrobia bacterium]|nr:DUF262 domain-containing protein [Elusimicrobiota bacterium]